MHRDSLICNLFFFLSLKGSGPSSNVYTVFPVLKKNYKILLKIISKYKKKSQFIKNKILHILHYDGIRTQPTKEFYLYQAKK